MYLLMRASKYLTAPSLSPWVQTAVKFAFLAASLATGAWLLYFAICTVLMPYPVEYREGAAQVSTALLLHGRNPFAVENQPLGMNNYGFAYNLIVVPFAAIFGNTLLVHRAVTLFFILLTIALVFLIVRKLNGVTGLALLAGVIVAMGLAGRGGLGAFPSAMGSFLFLGALAVPYACSFDRRSLLGSALLCVVAFYTKPYFVLAFGIIASYSFLFVSKGKALRYAFLFGVLFAVAYGVIRITSEFYFVDTLIGNWSNSIDTVSQQHLEVQLQEALDEYYPLIILGAGCLLAWGFGVVARSAGSPLPAVDVRSLDSPTFATPLPFWAYSFLCSLLAFLLILGPHKGAYMTYLYQLVAPLFLIWLCSRQYAGTRLALLSMPLLGLNALLLVRAVLAPSLLAQSTSHDWADLYGYVNSSSRVLNSPAIASRLMERGQWPTDSGQTEYYYAIRPYADNVLLGPDFDIVEKRGAEYDVAIRAALSNREYDSVILTEGRVNRYLHLLRKNYSQVGRITVRMPQAGERWTLVIWKLLP